MLKTRRHLSEWIIHYYERLNFPWENRAAIVSKTSINTVITINGNYTAEKSPVHYDDTLENAWVIFSKICWPENYTYQSSDCLFFLNAIILWIAINQVSHKETYVSPSSVMVVSRFSSCSDSSELCVSCSSWTLEISQLCTSSDKLSPVMDEEP